MSFTGIAKTLTIVATAVNVADIALHVAIDDVEPLRVAGNVIVIVATVALLLWDRSRRPAVPVIAALLSLALNVVFIATEGIGPLGAVLVAATTLILLATGFAMRTRA